MCVKCKDSICQNKYVANVEIKPQAGDVVLCLSGPEVGRFAVLEGRVGKDINTFMMCFNANAFRDHRTVSCSGGPSYKSHASQLEYSGRKIKRSFWKWKEGITGAGNGENYRMKVNLWYFRQKNCWFNTRSLRDIDDYNFNIEKCNKMLDAVHHEIESLGINTLREYKVMRGNHLVTEYREFYNPMQDHHAQLVIDACEKLRALTLTWYEKPIGCGYIASIEVIGGSKTAFRSSKDVNDFLDAYGLEIDDTVTGPWEQVVVKPSLENWKPLELFQ